jgi:hypothetical protein
MYHGLRDDTQRNRSTENTQTFLTFFHKRRNEESVPCQGLTPITLVIPRYDWKLMKSKTSEGANGEGAPCENQFFSERLTKKISPKNAIAILGEIMYVLHS